MRAEVEKYIASLHGVVGAHPPPEASSQSPGSQTRYHEKRRIRIPIFSCFQEIGGIIILENQLNPSMDPGACVRSLVLVPFL